MVKMEMQGTQGSGKIGFELGSQETMKKHQALGFMGS
jgi:hypothetical protein